MELLTACFIVAMGILEILAILAFAAFMLAFAIGAFFALFVHDNKHVKQVKASRYDTKYWDEVSAQLTIR